MRGQSESRMGSRTGAGKVEGAGMGEWNEGGEGGAVKYSYFDIGKGRASSDPDGHCLSVLL